MLRSLLNKSKVQKGFTIIEVMIVLAIAGLILVVVLIAIPQLQRNQRNQARQSILNRISTEVANYSGNNNGTYPARATPDVAGNFGTLQTNTNAFTGRYLRGVDINDPSTGNPVTFDLASAIATLPAQGVVKYFVNAQCGVDGVMIAGTGNRTYALSYGLEGNRAYCVDNS
jgi:prepilin-type N-terminal cleavage/methylation domain-containing protein